MNGDPFLTQPPGTRGVAGTVVSGAKGGYDGGGGSGSGFGVVGGGILIMVPFLIFCTSMCLHGFIFHHSPYIVWLVGIGFTCLSFIFMSLAGRLDGRWYAVLGTLCLVAVIFGNTLGVYNYDTHFLQYWAYDENRTYSNVLPSEPAAAHADAGKLEFAQEARIDTTKAVGYKEGSVYCVAPVMAATQSARIEYWAAGVDCCKQRADFQCDDANDDQARSGVVILDTNSIIASPHDYYVKAVMEAEAAYDLVSAKHPLFIRWVREPQAVQEYYWRQGLGTLVAACGVYFLISLVFGIAGAMGAKRGSVPPRSAP